MLRILLFTLLICFGVSSYAEDVTIIKPAHPDYQTTFNEIELNSDIILKNIVRYFEINKLYPYITQDKRMNVQVVGFESEFYQIKKQLFMIHVICELQQGKQSYKALFRVGIDTQHKDVLKVDLLYLGNKLISTVLFADTYKSLANLAYNDNLLTVEQLKTMVTYL